MRRNGIAALLLTLCLLSGCGERTNQVASAEDMATPVELDTENLTPIYADSIKDGIYEVTVDSSSPMFKVTRCELRKSGDSMSAYMTMSGKGYKYLCVATAEKAAASPREAYIRYEENADGERVFSFPVWGLDMPMPCAAFSEKKELWYDRTIVFRADSLPLDAFEEGTVTTLEELRLSDGEYTVKVELSGGSGKASVQSPARMWVRDGGATAEIVWGSANYDYMIVDGERYDAEIVDGHSTFVIPVAGFDFKLPVIADTTAMSRPHEIEYTLRFDRSSVITVLP